jgi:hypothetical protein
MEKTKTMETQVVGLHHVRKFDAEQKPAQRVSGDLLQGHRNIMLILWDRALFEYWALSKVRQQRRLQMSIRKVPVSQFKQRGQSLIKFIEPVYLMATLSMQCLRKI